MMRVGARIFVTSAIFVALAAHSYAGPAKSCPVLLVKAEANQNTLSITFKNNAEKAIREISFTCRLVDSQADKAIHAHCYETAANFLPASEHTVQYQFERGIPGTVLVSVRSITFTDGAKWGSPKDGCDVLKIPVKP